MGVVKLVLVVEPGREVVIVDDVEDFVLSNALVSTSIICDLERAIQECDRR